MRGREFIILVCNAWAAVNSHRRLVWLLVVCTAMALLFATRASFAAAEPKTILILQSYGQNFKPWSEYSKAFRQELERRSPWRLIIHEFSVVTARGEEDKAEYQLADYLRSIFANRPPDLMVTFGAPGAAFAQTHRKEIFPGVPLILASIEPRRVQSALLTENDTVVSFRHNIPVLFGNILQLLPDTKTVAVVMGNSPNERFWTLQVEKELEPLKKRVTFLFYNELSFDEILGQVASLPPHSAIFWGQLQVDAIGTMLEGDRALRELSAVANAPIFSFDDSFFDGGIVGGPMSSVFAITRITTDVALRILGGEKPAAITTPVLQYGPAKYDWRQLQRWRISESRLPPGSEIQFREPTMWERYRQQVVAGCALLLLQAALISDLLYERHRRQLAEVQVGRRTQQLIHSNRFSVAGELTAMMAHELNQPLGAILTNAETAELILKSSAPSLHELGEIITDIRRDDQRASEVLLRLRSILRRAPFQNRNFDLNEIASESIQLLSPLARDRKVDLSAVIAPMPLPITGDSVQLQQVITNLIVNAMDVMSKMPRAERRVIVCTGQADNFAELSVSDTGPGIPSDKVKEVFEPFFTTKPQGMGIGLSIARTIVEAHNGRIWAENQAGTGAVFHVRLPLAAGSPQRSYKPTVSGCDETGSEESNAQFGLKSGS
jgi:signal transduction histidine kinase